PPIFEPLRTLTTDDARSRTIREAVRRNIAVYSPHTALDAAEGGVNDWLCDGIGKGKRRPIRPAQCKSAQFKLVTFVPHEHADALRSALARAGAGVIGGYTECSFNLAGEGTFRGGAGTSPTVGKAGRFERVPELRIEMVCPQSALAAVVAALRETHPYEEPAFDLYRLELPPADATVGQGRVVELDRPVSAAALV